MSKETENKLDESENSNITNKNNKIGEWTWNGICFSCEILLN